MAKVTRNILLSVFWLFPSISFGEEVDLPRVLILGDTVYQQPARDAAKLLEGKVEVVFPAIQPGEVRNTATFLAKLNVLLDGERWDLIHLNSGLGDLVYRAPNMKAFRVMPIHAGGIRAVNSSQYERNLRLIVKQLKTTGAKLIWASTTPIRHSSSNLFELGSEVEYNSIAAGVMADEKIRVNDMYTYVKNLIDMDRPASHGADPFFFDRKPLHPPIVQTILTELHVE